MTAPHFDAEFRRTLHDLIAWRRDVRRFKTDAVPAGTFERLVGIAALAPSVGLSQPWRFVLVEDAQRRQAVRGNFAAANAEALAGYADERQRLYASLKLAGLDKAPVQFAVFADRDTPQGAGLGRRTMPEMIEYSAVAAMNTLWLAARAEGLGLGWISILDPSALSALLDVSPAWKFVGYFCLGYAETEEITPELERAGWEHRRPAGDFILHR